MNKQFSEAQNNLIDYFCVRRRIMTKIYVCERGNVYEGGRVFYASTSYIKAWLAVRAIRLESTNSYYNNPKFNFSFRRKIRNEMKAEAKNYWSDGYDYVRIYVFED